MNLSWIKSNITVFHFIIFSTAIYLFFILYLASFNRLALDDYCFKSAVLSKGIFKSIPIYYTSWQGRFGSHLIINSIIFLHNQGISLFFYLFLLVLVYIYALFKIIKIFTAPYKPSLIIILSTALCIFCTFLITVYDLSSFYWLNASVMYFGGIAFALLGLSEFFSKSKSFISYLILLSSFVIAGSSAENFALIFNLLIICYLNYQYFLTKKTPLSKQLIAFVCCFLAFLAMVTASGNQVRRSAFPETDALYALYRSVKYVYYTILALMAQRAVFLLVMSVLLAYVGSIFRGNNSINEKKYIQYISIGCPLFLVLLVASVFPNVYAMGGIGEYRSLAHIAFYTVAFIAVYSFLFGYLTPLPKQVLQLFSFASCLSFIIMANDLRIKAHYTKNYILSEDAKIEYLRGLKKQNFQGRAKASLLNDSRDNIFVVNDFTNEQNGFAKECFCESEGIKFEISNTF